MFDFIGTIFQLYFIIKVREVNIKCHLICILTLMYVIWIYCSLCLLSINWNFIYCCLAFSIFIYSRHNLIEIYFSCLAFITSWYLQQSSIHCFFRNSELKLCIYSWHAFKKSLNFNRWFYCIIYFNSSYAFILVSIAAKLLL